MLFERFNQHLNAKGYIARGGQMVDATIVPVPQQRNSREENETVKRGETPVAWEEKPRTGRKIKMHAGPRNTARAFSGTRILFARFAAALAFDSGRPRAPRTQMRLRKPRAASFSSASADR